MDTIPTTSLIGVTGCRKIIDGYEFDCAGHKYLAAVENACSALALIIPTSGNDLDSKTLLARVDGIVFTGSPSNVEPHHYNGRPSAEGTLHDARRDATALPLIREAVETGVPILCICRGFQEMNVAFGGTLHQRTYDVDGLDDHREDTSAPMETRYAPVHDIRLRNGGVFQDFAGGPGAQVNSLHAQGLDRLGGGLEAEAWAPDGIVEAISVKGAAAFAIGVQWHPEWRVMETPFHRALFEAFSTACRQRRTARSDLEQHQLRQTG